VVFVAIAGEIALKSERTRPRFERRLVRNVEDALARNDVSYDSIEVVDGRLLVRTRHAEEALHVLTRVFGVHGVTIAYEFEYQSLSDLAATVEEVAASWVKGRRFAVRARRARAEGFTSLDVAREVGARLKPYSAGVDLENPDVEVYVEVRGRVAYVHKGFEKGPGGLPIGVEGRALALFSGGIDSPVATWLVAKRGVEVDLLHYVLADPRSADEALEVAKVLASKWLYGYKPKLYVVDFRVVTGIVAAKVRREYAQVVLRAAMYTYASSFAEKHGYQAIVTGESLGQVSTQTLGNLSALERVLARMLPIPLILRPLAGMDKEEIVQLARRIGTYEASTKVREYCRIAQEGRVVTRADPKVLEEELSKVRDYVDLALVLAEHELS
jgi:thiamine biosynthesis protein ThiI